MYISHFLSDYWYGGEGGCEGSRDWHTSIPMRAPGGTIALPPCCILRFLYMKETSRVDGNPYHSHPVLKLARIYGFTYTEKRGFMFDKKTYVTRAMAGSKTTSRRKDIT